MGDQLEEMIMDRLGDVSIPVADSDTIREFATFLEQSGPPPGQPGYDRQRATRALARFQPDQIADLYLECADRLARAREEIALLRRGRPTARIDSPRVTERDLAVLALFAEGLGVVAIARRLDLSDRTVRRRVRALCDRLGVPSATAAVAWAIRCGVI